ncbi:hypothetical protein ACKKBG_A23630 [Auxenochlorella protothecoides x Auxenochlorella symbiontica]
MLEQGPGSLAPAVTVPEPLPPLPVDVWVRILQLIFTEDLTPLKSLVRLQLVSRTVLEAVRSLPLTTEVISEPALQSLRPLLQACPCASLSFHRSVDGESLLRHPGFRAMSGRTLTSLRAVVACTDTLSRFPALERLVLEAGAIQRFYPSVLHGGLRNLRSLSLVRFPEMELQGLDPVLLPSLREVHVTPRPLALRCAFHLALPPALHLDRLVLHGSFPDITSPASAPVVDVEAGALARQVAACRIEAQTLRVAMPRLDLRPPRALCAVDLLRELCCVGATWTELDLRLLDHRLWLVPPTPPDALVPAPAVGLHPEDLLVEAARVPCLMATLSWKQSGICRYPVVVLSRFDPSPGDDSDGAR